ncbi:hypothetical protein Glove_66g27 [Diversispora epigaea]|uniref:Uncharacterized protein n=1 Tax=Diversispora epigaea TaxID=1348612 RepID=A0A397JBL9_9GLOM|nr:hypothetical protein Glove_66g27 [Diversispora epigaea]
MPFDVYANYVRKAVKEYSDDNIQDIINARNSMKRASEAMAIKYKISTRRVYQIWRENHPPIDPREMISQPINIESISSTKKNNQKKKVSINNVETKPYCSVINHSEVLSDESVKVVQPKIRNSTSSHARRILKN